MPMTRFLTCLICLYYLFPAASNAAALTVNVTDMQGILLSDAVVELMPNTPFSAPSAAHYEMRQKNRIFSPFVLAVPQGAEVDFPNMDRTRHHVYSFSEAKQFELKLYVGKSEAPILFDKPGLVAIGCNIHDYMQAFIYVAKSPYVAVSDEQGQIQFTDLPDGQYQVKLWHPWQIKPQQPTTATLNSGGNLLSLSLDIERQEKPSSPPSGFGTQYYEKASMRQHAK